MVTLHAPVHALHVQKLSDRIELRSTIPSDLELRFPLHERKLGISEMTYTELSVTESGSSYGEKESNNIECNGNYIVII